MGYRVKADVGVHTGGLERLRERLAVSSHRVILGRLR
jgi:hypothetical protein